MNVLEKLKIYKIKENKLQAESIKIFVDGVLESESALLFEEYQNSKIKN